MMLNKAAITERVAHYVQEIRRIVDGRRWVVTEGTLVAGSNMASELLTLGAESVLIIAGNTGTGTIADDPRIHSVKLGLVSKDMVSGAHDFDTALQDLPEDARAALELFDPNQAAMALGPPWLTVQSIAGRPLLGARPPHWQALEDKLVAEDLWEQADIPHAPSLIVQAELQALQEAAAKVDQGMGTVWVGDNQGGWHGGAHLTRWVRNESDARAAAQLLGERCEMARVMPFLDGIPCSIHTIVTAQGVYPIRPCEMITLRTEDSSQLQYAGASTNWVPSDAQADRMRHSAKAVGKYIQAKHDYRGTFTLDGVCTPDGFFPTEINPRLGGGLGRMSASIPDLPLSLLHHAMASGIDLDYRPRELAELIIAGVDLQPVIRGMLVISGLHGVEKQRIEVRYEGQSFTATEDSEQAHGHLQIGPANSGSIIFVSLQASLIAPGQSAAPIIAQALRAAGDHFGAPVPALTSAPDRR